MSWSSSVRVLSEYYYLCVCMHESNMTDASVNSNDFSVVAGVCHGVHNLLRIHSELTHVYQKVQFTGHKRILKRKKKNRWKKYFSF